LRTRESEEASVFRLAVGFLAAAVAIIGCASLIGATVYFWDHPIKVYPKHIYGSRPDLVNGPLDR
jgi:hypothetical protein